MEIKAYNLYHLGDCVYSIIFFNKFLEKYDAEITFNCNPSYHTELIALANPKIKFGTQIEGINCWIQADNFWGKFIQDKDVVYYDEFYLQYYNFFQEKFGIDEPLFENLRDTMYDSDDLNHRRYQDYDFLIINSVGFSGQFQYNSNDFEDLANSLKSRNFKIITTKKIPGFECTLDKNMSLKDIGNLAIGCKNIISIHTAPFSTAINKKSIETVKKWVLLNDKNINYKIVDMNYYDSVKKINIDDDF